MPKEIERKYLVKDSHFLEGLKGKSIVQGYMADTPLTTRVRIKEDKAFLTLKGPTTGMSRDEFEYAIPLEDAQAMLSNYCGNRVVEKVRYEVVVGAHTWEVDVFSGAHEGLVVAEVELSDEDESFVRPSWIGEEITFDGRFTNAYLSTHVAPAYSPTVYDDFLFFDSPAPEFTAAIALRHAEASFTGSVEHLELALHSREGVVLVDTLLNRGNGPTRFFVVNVKHGRLDVLDTPVKAVDKDLFPKLGQMMAPLLKAYGERLDFGLLSEEEKMAVLAGSPV